MRGFFPLIDNDTSHKEFFDMGCPYEEVDETERTKYLVEETPMPQGSDYADICSSYRAHYIFMRQVGMRVAEYLAIGLGKERDFFTPWFAYAPLATFRSIYYPPRGNSNVNQDRLDEA